MSVKSTANKVVKVPNKIGLNAGTLGLGLLAFAAGVAGSFVLNRFDNVATRNINQIKAGQMPMGI